MKTPQPAWRVPGQIVDDQLQAPLRTQENAVGRLLTASRSSEEAIGVFATPLLSGRGIVTALREIDPGDAQVVFQLQWLPQPDAGTPN